MKINTSISKTEVKPTEPELPWVGRYANSDCIILFTGKTSDGRLNGVVINPGRSVMRVGDVDSWQSIGLVPFYGTITFETVP